MKLNKVMLLGTVSILLLGCASSGGSKELLTIRLQAGQQNAGSIGQASFTGQGDVTGFTALISGVPMGTSRPLLLNAYIYPGSCAELGAQPAFALNDTIQTEQTEGGWRLSRVIPTRLSALREGQFAVVLRTTAADRNVQIYCGDIR